MQALWQRAEGIPAAAGLAIQRGQPEQIPQDVRRVWQGEYAPTLADPLVNVGVPRPLASGVGFMASLPIGGGFFKGPIQGLSIKEVKPFQFKTTKALNNAIKSSEEVINTKTTGPIVVQKASSMPKRTTDIKGMPAMDIDPQYPLHSPELHKFSYLADHDKLLLGRQGDFHGEILQQLGYGNKAREHWWNTGDYPLQLPYFDKPEHIRAIVQTNPNSIVIGVRPSAIAMETVNPEIRQDFMDRYDESLKKMIEKVWNMSDKPVYIKTGVTNDQLNVGLENMKQSMIDKARASGVLKKVDKDFFKKNIILNGEIVKKASSSKR